METKFQTVFLTILISFNCLFAQDYMRYSDYTNNGNYGAITAFPDSLVADDYGPRRTSDKFHGGIDYNHGEGGGDDMWSLLYSPFDGTVVDVNNLLVENGYKQVVEVLN